MRKVTHGDFGARSIDQRPDLSGLWASALVFVSIRREGGPPYVTQERLLP